MQALHAYGCWVIELLSRWTTEWGRTPLEPLAAAKRAFSAAPTLPLRSFARAVCALPSRLNVPHRMRGTGRGALAWRRLHLPPSHSLEPLSRSPRATAHCGKCSQQNRTATEVTAGLPGRKCWNGGSSCVRAGYRCKTTVVALILAQLPPWQRIGAAVSLRLVLSSRIPLPAPNTATFTVLSHPAVLHCSTNRRESYRLLGHTVGNRMLRQPLSSVYQATNNRCG